MNYDREADILYLAHQLWEEMDTPDATPQTCWTQAALQVMARPCKSAEREADTSRYQRYAQPGLVICMDRGTGPVRRGVTFIGDHVSSEAANQPLRQIRRLAD